MNAILLFVRNMMPYMMMIAPVYAAARFYILRRGKQKVNWYHEAGLFAFAVFIAGLASQTVIPKIQCGADGLEIASQGTHETWLIPFRFVCYTYEDIFVRHSSYSILINVLGNIVMFMPFGFFPPLLWQTSGKKAVAAGFCASLFVELTQLFLPRSTDIDDLMLNTAGAALGFLLYRLLQSIFGGFMEKFS